MHNFGELLTRNGLGYAVRQEVHVRWSANACKQHAARSLATLCAGSLRLSSWECEESEDVAVALYPHWIYKTQDEASIITTCLEFCYQLSQASFQLGP
jgi:hypothetical protein